MELDSVKRIFLAVMVIVLASIPFVEAESLCQGASCNTAGNPIAANQSQSGINQVTNTAAPTFVTPMSVGISGDILPSVDVVSDTAGSCAKDQLVIGIGAQKSWLDGGNRDIFQGSNSSYGLGAGINYVKAMGTGGDNCEKMQELITSAKRVKNEAALQNTCFSLMASFKANGLKADESFYEAFPKMAQCRWYLDQVKIQPAAFSNNTHVQKMKKAEMPTNFKAASETNVYDWTVHVARGRLSDESKEGIVKRIKSMQFPRGTDLVFTKSTRYTGLEYVNVVGFTSKTQATNYAEKLRDVAKQPYLMIRPTN